MIRFSSNFFAILLLTTLALLGPFFFPAPFAFMLGFFAALFFPPVMLVVGALLDVLYFAHGSGAIPYFTFLGIIATAVAAFVHEFIKTRIMS